MADTARRDIVVPCDGAGHKVRLAGGVRFFARARCPRCLAPVDPTRRGRLARFLANLRRPASDHPVDRAIWTTSLAGLGLAIFTAVLFHQLADQWWLATLLLFGPRWLLLVPVLPLAILASVRDRALLLPLLVAGWIILGPIMGFQTGWRSLLVGSDSGRDITAVTFNTRSADAIGVGAEVDALMDEWEADIAVLQECGFVLRQRIEAMPGWHVWTGQSQCLVSRLPILQTRVMAADELWSIGGSGLVASHLVSGAGGPFWLTNVHLETPRAGLDLIRRGSILEGIRVLEQDSNLRDVEHRRAERFVGTLEGPRIVMGDFNAPDESRIYREHWGSWRNAFASVGVGLGGTRLNGWIRTRIDHALTDESWRVVGARLGRDVGSDHLPLIVTIRRD